MYTCGMQAKTQSLDKPRRDIIEQWQCDDQTKSDWVGDTVMPFTVEEFPMQDIFTQNNKNVFHIIHKRTSGTGSLLQTLYKQLCGNCDRALVVSPSNKHAEELATLLPTQHIASTLTATTFKEFVEQRKQSPTTTSIALPTTDTVLVVLRNCLFERRTMGNKWVRHLHANARQLNIKLVVTYLCVLDIPKSWTSAVDCFFVSMNIYDRNAMDLLTGFVDDDPRCKILLSHLAGKGYFMVVDMNKIVGETPQAGCIGTHRFYWCEPQDSQGNGWTSKALVP